MWSTPACVGEWSANSAGSDPSPLTRGDQGIWAAGVVYAVGQLNFVFDPSQSPHATADQLSGWLGVKKTTMANKARLIRDTLQLSDFESEFMRRDLVEASPLTWLLEVDGLLVDIRHAPAQLSSAGLRARVDSVRPRGCR